MNRYSALVISALCFACGVAYAAPENSGQKCPVAIEQVELAFNHAGGHSLPELKVKFGNTARKGISSIEFRLSQIDSAGEPHPYPDGLQYSDGLEGGKEKTFTWDLEFSLVDMHRAGETVFVQRVEFADSKTWLDDGTESCEFTVDFHPK